jgi:hypothetical protein
MSSEIIQSVVSDSYDNFGHVNFIFSQNFISLFWGLFNDETDLRVVRYVNEKVFASAEHIFNELCATQLDGQTDATYMLTTQMHMFNWASVTAI